MDEIRTKSFTRLLFWIVEFSVGPGTPHSRKKRVCPECGKYYRMNAWLQKHLAMKHGG